MGTMKTTCRDRQGAFSLSIRLLHPSFSADKLAAILGRPANVVQSVGEPRKTLKGSPLTGKYGETYCLFDGPNSDDAEKLLNWGIDVVDKREGFMREFTESGGRAEFRIACFVDSYLGMQLSTSNLHDCVRLGVMIGVEIYGPT